MYMKINISNNTKAAFSSLSIGEIFIINETDVCMKIGWGSDYNTWNFQSKGTQTVGIDTKVTIPKEASLEVIL